MEDINNKLYKLSKSKFRSSFHLRKYMIDYINEKGMDVVKSHTVDFIKEKLQPANPKNDGKQTPMKGHPTFMAMHACACCCRGCLEKWHHIEKGRELTKDECNYIYKLLITWIIKEYENYMK
jgi:hypothetical protein